MKRLRAETREQHEALESALPLGSAGLTPSAYARLLQRFWGFYNTWEAKAGSSAPAHLRALVAGRRKLVLIEADIHVLLADRGPHPSEESPTLDPAWLPDMASEAGLLGSMYVVEGSTLGGQIIARQLERDFHFASGHGYSFFQSYGKAVGQQWKEFGAVVKAMPEEAAPGTVAAAQHTFRAFHQWFAEQPEGTGA